MTPPNVRPLHVAVHKVIDDLDPLLDRVLLTKRPASGPFASRGGGPPLPGRVQYLGGGAVRLDDVAVSALAELERMRFSHRHY